MNRFWLSTSPLAHGFMKSITRRHVWYAPYGTVSTRLRGNGALGFRFLRVQNIAGRPTIDPITPPPSSDTLCVQIATRLMVALQSLFNASMAAAIGIYQTSFPLETYQVMEVGQPNNTLVFSAYFENDTLATSQSFEAMADITQALQAYQAGTEDSASAVKRDPCTGLYRRDDHVSLPIKRLSRCGQYCSTSAGCSFGCYACSADAPGNWRKRCRVTWGC